VGRESKTETCGDWENQTEKRVECEGRAKQRDVLSGKGEQNGEMC